MQIAEMTAAPNAIDRRRLVLGLSGLAAATLPRPAAAETARAAQAAAPNYPVTYHRTRTVDGLKIFYREAGPADAPVCCKAFRPRRICSAT